MPLLVIIILLILAWFLYKLIYYRSNSFIELKNKIEKYIKYYNEKRIKEKLGWMSPVQYRLNTLAA